jgi:Xaa-Pro aminopeptidase
LTLSASGCRNRQASLRDALQCLGADAGLIVDPGHLSYFFGGYKADLCRTYAVSGELSDAQRFAIDAVASALVHAEGRIAPGVSCKDVFAEIHARLDGQRGFKFHHHLGHGIGLAPHEAPRVNPHWDDVFEVGDVFTLEPGLYGHELRAGVRIEHDYLVTDSGLIRLSNPWPAALADPSVRPKFAFSTQV